jgi:aminopeptidase Y
MSDSDAEPYLANLRAGETINTTAFIDSFVGTIATTNIIAQTWEGDPEQARLLYAISRIDIVLKNRFRIDLA